MKIIENLPLDIINTLLDCHIQFLFNKFRIENIDNITIYHNPNTNKLEHLNSSGTYLFQLANSKLTIGEMINNFLKHYRLDDDNKHIVTKDIFLFIRSMERKGLVKIIW